MGKHSKKTKQQKTERKKASARASDYKSVQELQELAARSNLLEEQHSKICASIQGEEMKKKRANLIMQELKEFRNVAGPGRIFRGIGRCFLLSTDEEVLIEHEETIAQCDKAIPAYKAIQAQFETKMMREQENLKSIANDLKQLKVG